MTPLEILLLVLKPVAKMCLVAGFAYFIFRKGFLSYKVHTFMSKSVLYVTLPCLLFAKLAQATNLLEVYGNWYLLPLSAVVIIASGGAIGFVVSKLFLKTDREKTVCPLMCGLNNAGYFPLLLVRGIFPEYSDLDVLIMIYVILASPLLWTISPAVLSGGENRKINFSKMLNPPVYSITAGFTAMMLGLGQWMDTVPVGDLTLTHYTLAPMAIVGELSIPFILFVLGGTLAKIPSAKPQNPRFLSVLIGTKLVLMPCLGLLVIPLIGFSPLIGLVMMIECMQPPALNLSVHAREFADEETGKMISEGLYFCYIISIFTLTIFSTILKGMTL